MSFKIFTRALAALALGATLSAPPALGSDTGPTIDPNGMRPPAPETGPSIDPDGAAWSARAETGPSIDPNGIVPAGQRDTGHTG